MFSKGGRFVLHEKLVAAAITLLFVFYANYLPIHLAAAHAHDVHYEAGDHVHDPGHAGHNDHHVPHPASEQEIQLHSKPKQGWVWLVFLAGKDETEAPAPPRILTAGESRPEFSVRVRGPALAQSRAPPPS